MPHTLNAWAPVPIRVIAGSCLAYRGGPELFSRHAHENIVHLTREMGGPAPEVMAWPIAALQLFGGLGLIGGVRVRPIAGAVLGMMGFHLFQGLRRGFAQSLPGCQPPPSPEAALLFCGCSAALLLTGPGRWSLRPTAADGAVSRLI
ncbi:MAG TPA: DoxX family membrane protein [Thermoleophilaceae bacterium]|jgi:uncharacterized membrane protein YphA (DoxX/SURF4 family)